MHISRIHGTENGTIEKQEEQNQLNGASKGLNGNGLTMNRISNELKPPRPVMSRRLSDQDDSTLGATRGMQTLNFL